MSVLDGAFKIDVGYIHGIKDFKYEIQGTCDDTDLEAIQSSEYFVDFIDKMVLIFNFFCNYGHIIVQIMKGKIQTYSILEGFILKSGASSIIQSITRVVPSSSTIDLERLEGHLYPKGMYILIDKIFKSEVDEVIDKIPLKWFDSIFSNNTLRNSINKTEVSFMDEYSEVLYSNYQYTFNECTITLDNFITTLNRWLDTVDFTYRISHNKSEKYKIQIIEENSEYYITITKQ